MPGRVYEREFHDFPVFNIRPDRIYSSPVHISSGCTPTPAANVGRDAFGEFRERAANVFPPFGCNGHWIFAMMLTLANPAPLVLERKSKIVVVPVPVVTQKFDFDCGYACVAMVSRCVARFPRPASCCSIIRGKRRRVFRRNRFLVFALCLARRWLQSPAQYVNTKDLLHSPWTVDLCVELRKINPKTRFVYSTGFVGVRRDYEQLAFYRDEINDDRERVSRLFTEADQRGISVKQRILSDEELRAHLDMGNISIVLIDSVKLIGQQSRYDKPPTTSEKLISSFLLSAANLISFGTDYMGHYVVLCGYDESRDCALIRNPSFEGLFAVPWSAFSRARHAFGTDDDVILVYDDSNFADQI